MRLRRTLGWSAAALMVGATVVLAWHGVPFLTWPLRIILGGLLVLFLLWLLVRGLRLFLWRVGRRLALSYFLIGVLPIPMVLLLFLLAGYLHSGFFLGHLYRDGVTATTGELAEAAAHHLAPLRQGATPETFDDQGREFAYYRAGVRVGGTLRAPANWPAWIEELDPLPADPTRENVQPFVALDDGTAALLATAGDARLGVLALHADHLEEALSRHSDVVVRLLRSDDPRRESLVQLRFFGMDLPLQAPLLGRGGDANEPAAAKDERRLWDRPVLVWGELSGPLRALADGSVVSDYVTASLTSSPREVYRHLFSSSAEVDTAAWAAVLGVASLLSTIYLVAAFMALAMIFALSRAVNRLSRATEAVRAGRFSARIPVRRRDQIGDLQRSFNQMAADLEQLVATATQKEVLEKELEIARELQQSLLPTDLPQAEAVEFATLFEPSSAIGGDYFDILRIDEARLAVVIADVSGHGLPTGLRMAMVKAALTILVEEGRQPEEILRKLDRMIRAAKDSRLFVTLTIALVDTRGGTLELTNAGHPPTYLVRDGQVEEILLPGPPLGALAGPFGHSRRALARGDVVVWLSDGLIEATDARGEPFGYQRVRTALAVAGGPTQVKDSLLAAVSRHSGGAPIDDDRTLVAMGYRLASASPSKP